MATSRKAEESSLPVAVHSASPKNADGRLNCQNHFFGSLSEMISLLEHEWGCPENSDLFR
jgi:hypothetical protein